MECNTAYGGNRSTTEAHCRAISERINDLHGTWTVEYGEQIGLGTQAYNLIDLDNQASVDRNISDKGTPVYNVYTVDGKRVLSMATAIDSLTAGVYIVNGQKQVVK
ncbi:MAG: hypothetical protein K2G86_08555 [Prevotella sp.]|nr:hypothetical protein [Prevotella sp.]